MKTTTKIATGFVAGTLLGATLALLFAPMKGSKTRAFLVDKTKDVSDSVSQSYSKAKDMISNGRKPVSV